MGTRMGGNWASLTGEHFSDINDVHNVFSTSFLTVWCAILSPKSFTYIVALNEVLVIQ